GVIRARSAPALLHTLPLRAEGGGRLRPARKRSHGFPQMYPLAELESGVPCVCEKRFRLDTFCDRHKAQLRAQLHDAAQKCFVARVLAQPLDQRAAHLDEIDMKAVEILERCGAGPEIV